MYEGQGIISENNIKTDLPLWMECFYGRKLSKVSFGGGSSFEAEKYNRSILQFVFYNSFIFCPICSFTTWE